MKNSNIKHLRTIKDRNIASPGSGKEIIYMSSPQRSYVVKVDEKTDY